MWEHMSNPQENGSSSGLRRKSRAAFIVRLVMFKSKEKNKYDNDKKPLQYIMLLTAISGWHHRYYKRFIVVQEQVFSC